MFTILNRMRGQYGWFSKVNALLLAILLFIILFIWGKYAYLAVVCGLGYLAGESMGWGVWVSALLAHSGYTDEKEAPKSGISQIASKLFDPKKHWLWYARTALAIRGLYWFIPTYVALYFAGANAIVLSIAILVLAISFPISCEIAHLKPNMIRFKKVIKLGKKELKFCSESAWDEMEIIYGFIQDIALIVIILSIVF